MCKLGFDPSGKYLVSTGDRFIRIFHNIIGLRALVSDLEAKLKKTTSGAMKERLNYQIKSTRYVIGSHFYTNTNYEYVHFL